MGVHRGFLPVLPVLHLNDERMIDLCNTTYIAKCRKGRGNVTSLKVVNLHGVNSGPST